MILYKYEWSVKFLKQGWGINALLTPLGYSDFKTMIISNNL